MLGTEALLSRRVPEQISMVQGLRHHAAGARYVRRSARRCWLGRSAYEGSPFTFVGDGLESAVAQAKAVAGDRDVGVIGANLVQQCIRSGLLDEIHLDLVPVLLGDGVRLFDQSAEPIELESTRVIGGAGVTHLTFRVVK
jgi:dihydrofolate reductase